MKAHKHILPGFSKLLVTQKGINYHAVFQRGLEEYEADKPDKPINQINQINQ